jgi:murein DD-endopeptidase MepM/ murein hydrolase activator NlpD
VQRSELEAPLCGVVVVGKWHKAFAIALLLVVAACGGRAVYHRVRPGDTLYRIGSAYGIPYQEIARANDIGDPTLLRVGQKLLIPKAKKVVAVPIARSGKPGGSRSGERPTDAPKLYWPMPNGIVTSGYGPRGKSFHDGIDIAAPVGAPVRAAADGEVVYSSTLSGYGNVIILRHGRGYATVYAHNRRHHVKDGQKVRRGQLIAEVGRSGRTTGPNLHFEVRKDNVAKNPMYFLPSEMRAVAER